MDQLRGRKIVVLVNLEPAKLRGIESRGMLLAGEDKPHVGLVLPPDQSPVGSQVLGDKGAPVQPFTEFQKYKLYVGPGSSVLFIGHGVNAMKIKLSVDGEQLKCDFVSIQGTCVS